MYYVAACSVEKTLTLSIELSEHTIEDYILSFTTSIDCHSWNQSIHY